MKRIRVLIVDDSSLARGMLRAFLEGEADIEIAGEAANGREAVDLVAQLQPDLVTMDLQMPVMDGMTAIEAIMCAHAVPILVVSSVADAHNACEAIRRGALDAVNKPDYTPEQAADFVARVRMLAGVRVITHIRPRATPAGAAPSPAPRPHGAAASSATSAATTSGALSAPMSAAMSAPASAAPEPAAGAPCRRIFAIASSTGGPQALALILPQLPADFPCPVVIAQHIADGFAGGMADWLGKLCALPVRIAAEGEALLPGTIYISPSERHLAVTAQRRVTLVERQPADRYRPSCDTLLESLATAFGRHVVGIILTGMGHDGARGMARVRAQGGITLGQDEASSVIYGMNQVAIAAGAVERILPVADIAAAMRQLANESTGAVAASSQP